jgi:hydrogenase nickel incorporation protein HypA/HybF
MLMHEMAVAESILHTILEHAERLGNARAIAARISCGQFNALNDQAMRFALETISEGTVCRGMRLDIRHIPLQATCKDCQTTFTFDVHRPTCTACGSTQYEFEADAPLLLEDIEFEDLSCL